MVQQKKSQLGTMRLRVPSLASLSGFLAWEPPYAEGAALKRQKRPKKKREREKVYPLMGETDKKHEKEFLLWLKRLRTQYRVHEVAGSIPGLTRWVKDLAV